LTGVKGSSRRLGGDTELRLAAIGIPLSAPAKPPPLDQQIGGLEDMFGIVGASHP